LCDYQLNIDIEIIRYDWFRWNLESKEPRLPGIQVKYFKDTTINFLEYDEVFLIRKNTILDQPKIAWLIKAKNKGIVEFYDLRRGLSGI
jgi:hypothetical protein